MHQIASVINSGRMGGKLDNCTKDINSISLFKKSKKWENLLKFDRMLIESISICYFLNSLIYAKNISWQLSLKSNWRILSRRINKFNLHFVKPELESKMMRGS